MSIFARCLAIACYVGAQVAVAEPITPAAEHLAQIIDRLNVEKRWPAGQYVEWESGIPDGRRPPIGPGNHTHCSAFVAAAAKHVGIYILRPPEHGQLLLANAQYDWLAQKGASKGWTHLDDAAAAQRYANEGWFVVATHKNQNAYKPGHIAIVRPSDKDASLLQEEGPQITQAGLTNYRSVSLATGFRAAWTQNEIQYYAHPVGGAGQ